MNTQPGSFGSSLPHLLVQFADTFGEQAFFLGDMTKLGVVYAIFLVGKRIFTSATLSLVDGSTNALMSMSMQAMDSFLLLIAHPYNDSQVTTTEAIAGLTTVAAYFALGLPTIYGPDLYPGDFITMVLSFTGVVVSAFASVMETLAMLTSSVRAFLSTVFVCLPAMQTGAAAGVGAGADVLAEAAAVVSEQAQGAAEELVDGDGDDGVEEEELLAASTAGLAVAMGRGILQTSTTGVYQANAGDLEIASPAKGMRRFRKVVSEIRSVRASREGSGEQGMSDGPFPLQGPSAWMKMWEESFIPRAFQQMSGEIGDTIARHPLPSLPHISIPFVEEGRTKYLEPHCELKSDLVFPRQSATSSVDSNAHGNV